MSKLGTVAVGVRLPIVREGDNLKEIIVKGVTEAYEELNMPAEKGDIVGVTESLVARAYGNYATVDDIAASINALYGGADWEENKSLVVVNPIYSRNRFAICLRGIARAARKITLVMPEYDEVGNPGWVEHPFTAMVYADYYRQICENEGVDDIVIVRSLDDVSDLDNNILVASIHQRNEVKKEILRTRNFRQVYTLADILSDKCEFGLLGSNKATEETVKLFPNIRKAKQFVYSLQEMLDNVLGGPVAEVMIYGDGAFKSPYDRGISIWELADPTVCPASTDGLNGYPNELKIKYLADDKYLHLQGDALTEAIKEDIALAGDVFGDMSSEGTTPRRITDGAGSLMDLLTGSGAKGTPVVLLKRYFKNYADD